MRDAAYNKTWFSDRMGSIQANSKDNTKMIKIDFDLEVIVEVTGRYIDVYEYDEYVGEIEMVVDGTEYIVIPQERKILEKIGL